MRAIIKKNQGICSLVSLMGDGAKTANRKTFHTVSIKFLSTRLNTTTAMNSTTSMKTVL